MKSDHPVQVLLVERGRGGHQSYFLQMMIKALAEASIKCHVITWQENLDNIEKDVRNSTARVFLLSSGSFYELAKYAMKSRRCGSSRLVVCEVDRLYFFHLALSLLFPQAYAIWMRSNLLAPVHSIRGVKVLIKRLLLSVSSSLFRVRPMFLDSAAFKKAQALGIREPVLLGDPVPERIRSKVIGHPISSKVKLGKAVRVLIAGHIDKRKNVELAVDYCLALRRYVDDVELRLIGKMSPDYRPTALNRLQRGKERGLKVVCIDRWVNEDEWVCELMASDIVFAAYKDFYASSNVVTQSILAGKILLVSPVGWSMVIGNEYDRAIFVESQTVSLCAGESFRRLTAMTTGNADSSVRLGATKVQTEDGFCAAFIEAVIARR